MCNEIAFIVGFVAGAGGLTIAVIVMLTSDKVEEWIDK